MEHECNQQEVIGRFKEFMEGYKGMKSTLFIISMTILLQVGTFLFLWGAQTEKIKNIEKIVSRFDKIKIVYAVGNNEK